MVNVGRTKKRSSGYRIDPEFRRNLLQRGKHTCHYGGSAYTLHVDHGKPRSRGGKDSHHIAVIVGYVMAASMALDGERG